MLSNQSLRKRFKIRLIIYTIILLSLLSLLFHSKFTISLKLDSSKLDASSASDLPDSFNFFDLFAITRRTPSLPSPPILRKKSKIYNNKLSPICNAECMTSTAAILILFSICLLLFIIYNYFKKFKNFFDKKKITDIEFGKERLEIEQLQIINKKKRKWMSYKQNQLPTIYEEHESASL